MELYIVRHGETAWNAINKIQGRTDIPLNEAGLSEAADAAEKLKDTKIDFIFTSPLLRSKKTAEVIAKYHPAVPIMEEPALIEMNYGIFEGGDRYDPAYIAAKSTAFTERYPKGESYLDMAARVYTLIDRLKEKYPDKSILLSCHNGVMRVAESYFTDMKMNDFVFFVAENAEVRHYSL